MSLKRLHDTQIKTGYNDKTTHKVVLQLTRTLYVKEK